MKNGLLPGSGAAGREFHGLMSEKIVAEGWVGGYSAASSAEAALGTGQFPGKRKAFGHSFLDDFWT